MRKFFEGLSLWEGALLSISLFFGFFFRFLGLAQTSAWGDEVATWYFSQNLLSVIQNESHTPFYYLLCKIWELVFPTSVLSLRYFTVVLSFACLFFCFFFYLKNKKQRKAVTLLILWCLWPTLIIYGRQARHYELFLDLTFVFLLLHEFRGSVRKIWYNVMLIFFQLVHPFAAIPVWFFGLKDFVLRKTKAIELLQTMLTTLPLILYYLYRFATQGKQHVMSNIMWISNGTVAFLKQMVILFAGDSFPLKVFYPVSSLSILFLCSLVVGVFFLSKSVRRLFSPELWDFCLILLSTVIGVEIVGLLGTNFRISRYFIYVVPFFHLALLALVETWSDFSYKLRLSFLVLGLVFYSVFLHQPWSTYVWDDQIVENFKSRFSGDKNLEHVVICGSAFQLKYYFDRPYRHCSEDAFKRYYQNSPFVFFDLNGNDRYTAWYLMANGRISGQTSFEHSYSFFFEGRKK